MKINKIIIISLALFIWTACENNNTTSSDSETNSSWIFVANEGEMLAFLSMVMTVAYREMDPFP